MPCSHCNARLSVSCFASTSTAGSSLQLQQCAINDTLKMRIPLHQHSLSGPTVSLWQIYSCQGSSGAVTRLARVEARCVVYFEQLTMAWQSIEVALKYISSSGSHMEDVSDVLKINTEETTVTCGVMENEVLVQLTPLGVHCCHMKFDSQTTEDNDAVEEGWSLLTVLRVLSSCIGSTYIAPSQDIAHWSHQTIIKLTG